MLESELSNYLPTGLIGEHRTFEPITLGLSGAQVFFVTSEIGRFVLRIPADSDVARRQNTLLQRMSDLGLAPKLIHIDEETGATISQAINGSFAAAFSNPGTAERAMSSVLQKLKVLHAIPLSEVAVSENAPYDRSIVNAEALWNAQSVRTGFPEWILPLRSVIEETRIALGADRRFVFSHNDFNPGNILWDGKEVRIIDWDFAGPNHLFYDVAALAMFLNLPQEAGLGLLRRLEGDFTESEAHLFGLLRQLIAILSGLTMLSQLSQLDEQPAWTFAEAPTLPECYHAIMSGEVPIQSDRGKKMLAVALLKNAMLSASLPTNTLSRPQLS